MENIDHDPDPIQWSQQVERLLIELTTIHISATAGRAETTQLAAKAALRFLTFAVDAEPHCGRPFIAASPGRVTVARKSFPSAHAAIVGVAHSCFDDLQDSLSPDGRLSR